MANRSTALPVGMNAIEESFVFFAKYEVAPTGCITHSFRYGTTKTGVGAEIGDLVGCRDSGDAQFGHGSLAHCSAMALHDDL